MIYTYIKYILFSNNIDNTEKNAKFIDCFFLRFINVPKFIMSDYIEIHLYVLRQHRIVHTLLGKILH